MDLDIHSQIEDAGERRRQSLAMADSALNDVVDLVPEALASGMTKRDIAELAGISRLTLDAVLRRRRDQESFEAKMRPPQIGDIKKVIDELSST